MAIRNIRMIGDDILTKKCKVVKEMTEKNKELIADMFDTMYDADGVGLAAPQVGILKRIAVIDITEDRSNPIVLINPEIISADGEQRGSEGCLSVPDKVGIVTRPNHVVVKAYNEEMEPFEIEGEELLARALVHEIEHLDGGLYVNKVEGDCIPLRNLKKNLENRRQHMNVIFMGTPDFSVPVLEGLIASKEHTVTAVVTQPDKARGRSGKLVFTPVKEVAVENDIPVYTPARKRCGICGTA